MTQTLFARQAILDVDRNTVAYELLFRDGDTGTANITDADRASSEVLLNAFDNLDIANVCGDALAFVNFTRS